MFTSVLIAAAALAAPAIAQTLPSNAPACAARCFTVKVTEAGTLAPGASDVAGYCQSPTFVQAYYNCLYDNCPLGDVATSVGLVGQVCASQGAAVVTSGITGAASSLQTSIPVSSVASSASGAVSSGASSVSGAVSSGLSSASSGISSASGAVSSGASSLSSGASSAVSEASSTLSGASSSASSLASGASSSASEALSSASGAVNTATSTAGGILSSVVSQASSVAGSATGAVGSAAASANPTSGASTYVPGVSLALVGLLAAIFA
ncbi:CFEM domain-containing protein [Sporobolomyces salmoneus]|uniref:CFEM domain-containing protein n=1 Tax=Sporobolomyces salmoneus TaxID=183962 RepID=UPI0031745326